MPYEITPKGFNWSFSHGMRGCSMCSHCVRQMDVSEEFNEALSELLSSPDQRVRDAVMTAKGWDVKEVPPVTEDETDEEEAKAEVKTFEHWLLGCCSVPSASPSPAPLLLLLLSWVQVGFIELSVRLLGTRHRHHCSLSVISSTQCNLCLVVS